jgi:hypothetical protein
MCDKALEAEVAYRIRLGQRQVSLAEMESEIRMVGYRFDRESDCRANATYLSGPRSGQTYPNLDLRPVQADNGIGWCSVYARRDANFDALRALSESMFAVVRGAVACW